MRLSVEKNDKGYQPMSVARLATVTLDGIVQTSCLVADEEEGFVLRYKRKGVVGFSRVGAQPQTERVKGEVKITWPEGFDVNSLVRT